MVLVQLIRMVGLRAGDAVGESGWACLLLVVLKSYGVKMGTEGLRPYF